MNLEVFNILHRELNSVDVESLTTLLQLVACKVRILYVFIFFTQYLFFGIQKQFFFVR
jgi:hypothetical protein